MVDKTMLKIESLHYSYDTTPILSIDAFTFKNGIYLVTGENGSGKSTLLTILAGLTDNYEGKLFFNGTEITKKNRLDYQEKYVSYLPQDAPVFENETVLNNILLPYAKKDKEKAMAFLEKVHLEDLANSKADSLSSGEKERLSFARMLYGVKKIVLLDEITANLDTDSQKILEDAILTLKEDHIVLFVSHEETTLLHKATHLVLKDKNLVCVEEHTEDSSKEIDSKVEGSLRKTTLLSYFASSWKRNKVFFLVASIATFLLTFTATLTLTIGLSFGNREYVTEYISNYLSQTAPLLLTSADNIDTIDKDTLYIPDSYCFSISDPTFGQVGRKTSSIFQIPVDDKETSEEVFKRRNIQLVDNSVDRYPTAEGELLISSYQYAYYQTQVENSNSREEVFAYIENKLSNSVDPYQGKIVGVYQGEILADYDKRLITTPERNYFGNDLYCFLYGFMCDTVFTIGSEISYRNVVFFVNTEANKNVDVSMLKENYLNYLNLYDDEYADLSLFTTKDGVNRLGQYQQKPTSYASVALVTGFILILLEIVLLAAFVVKNSRLYLLLRITGERRDNLLKSDFLLYGTISLAGVLSLFLSLLVSYLIGSFMASGLYGVALNPIHISGILIGFILLYFALLFLLASLIIRWVLLRKNLAKKLEKLKDK